MPSKKSTPRVKEKSNQMTVRQSVEERNLFLCLHLEKKERRKKF